MSIKALISGAGVATFTQLFERDVTEEDAIKFCHEFNVSEEAQHNPTEFLSIVTNNTAAKYSSPEDKCARAAAFRIGFGCYSMLKKWTTSGSLHPWRKTGTYTPQMLSSSIDNDHSIRPVSSGIHLHNVLATRGQDFQREWENAVPDDLVPEMRNKLQRNGIKPVANLIPTTIPTSDGESSSASSIPATREVKYVAKRTHNQFNFGCPSYDDLEETTTPTKKRDSSETVAATTASSPSPPSSTRGGAGKDAAQEDD